MAGTYAPINNNTELNKAITDLFGDNSQWVQQYFQNGTISGNDQQQAAFKKAMDTFLGGMFKNARDGVPITSEQLAPFLGDGRLDTAEFESLASQRDIATLRDQMGPELYEKFKVLAISTMNGIADRPSGKLQYSLPELREMFSDPFITKTFAPGEQRAALGFTIPLMNSLCGPQGAQADMSDAIPIPTAAQRIREGTIGRQP